MSRLIPVLRWSLALLTAFSIAACTSRKDEKTVNLAIWGNYLSPQMMQKFTAESGIQINVSNYSSNEELLAKLQAGAAGFDVAVPSDYMVDIMIKMQLLEKLGRESLTNFSLLNPALLAQAFDPRNDYSVPYSWTTTGIAVNRELYSEPVRSWKDLLDNPKVKGQISLLDDDREVLAAALKMNGHSVNSTDPTELEEAKKLLTKTKAAVKMFTSDTIDILTNKDVTMAQSYSSDALQAAKKTGQKIEYVIPVEGGTRSIDNLVILKSAPHLQNARTLINFLISPEADLDRVEKIFAGPVLSQTQKALPLSLQNSKALFPSAQTLQRMQALQDQGKNNRLYEEIWTQLKAQ